MTHLEIIKKAYDKVGILYVVRVRPKEEHNGVLWSYLITCNESTKAEYEAEDLDVLLRQNDFIEFEDGKLASY